MERWLVILLLLFAVQLEAQVRIGANEAMKTAEGFMKQEAKQTEFTLSLSETILSEQSGKDNLFVFSVRPKGFIIISALNEVLAYSTTSDFIAANDPPDHIAYWLHLYNNRTVFDDHYTGLYLIHIKCMDNHYYDKIVIQH